MAKKYTKEQQRVIDERNNNILVAAAAGSGKTAVLTDRIVSLTTDDENPIDVDQILVLTYTNAAAAEMRERIDGAISKKLSEAPNNVNLQKQKLLIQNSQISTIHSFCLFVLHNNFNDIGLDPGFRIMDEGERKLLLADTINDILEEYYKNNEEENDTAFTKLVECYASDISEGSLEDTVLAIHNFILSLRSPKKWISEARNDFKIRTVADFENSGWWKNGTLPTIEFMIDEGLALANKGINISSLADGPKNSIKGFNDYISLFDSLKTNKDYQSRYDLVHKASISRFSASPKADDDLKKQAKAIKEALANILNEFKDTYYLANVTTFINDNLVMEDVADKLLEIVNELYERFNNIKRKKNLIDFSDMEHLTLSILSDEEGNPTKTALEYRDFFKAVMVDEYQDINDVQEAILKSITRDNNYFMVGDVKQSIYRFRQARPEIFMGKYDTFADQGINTKIELNKNFRSRKEVLDFVNTVFEYVMRKKTSGIEYDENASLKAGALCYDKNSTISYNPEILLMAKPEKEEAKALNLEDDSRSAEALMVANKINELVGSDLEIYDKEADVYRHVSYKDIVILLFSVSSKGGIFKRTLESQGIPVVSENSTGYFSAEEIKAVLNLLEVINNPIQDIPMYGVLTGFFGKFTEEEIALIRSEVGKGNLYKNIIAYSKTNPDSELSKRIEEFLQNFTEYRFMTTYMGVRELLDKIVLGTGYIDFIAASKNGIQKKANVLLLLEKASDFEKTSYHGLFRFIRYIKQLKVKDADWGEAITLDENEDAVRIMTIHKSKGLEYPVCFVCATDSSFVQDDSRKSAVLNPEYGMALDMVDPIRRIKRKSFKRTILVRQAELDNIAEQMRVLYVALTRAREKLYITGTITCGKKEKEKGNTEKDVFLDKLMPANQFMDSEMFFVNSYLKMICNSISAHDLTNVFLRFYDASKLVNAAVKEEVKQGLSKEYLINSINDTSAGDAEYNSYINNNLQYNYPYGYLSELKGKVTVSQLKKNAFEESKSNSSNILNGDISDSTIDEAMTDGEAIVSEIPFEEDIIYYQMENASRSEDELNELSEKLRKNKLMKKKLARKDRFIPEFIKKKMEMANLEEAGASHDQKTNQRQDKLGKLDKVEKNVVGSACHKLMELIDYKLINLEKDAALSNNIEKLIEDTISNNIENGRMPEEYGPILRTGENTGFVSVRAAREFFNTELARRMIEADKVGKLFREKSFFMGISANEVNDSYPKEESVLVQGIVDVFFEDSDGEIVIVDYKTDNLDNISKDGGFTLEKEEKANTIAEKEEALRKRYKVQLDMYSRAVEKVTGKRIKEKIIFAFDLGKEVYL